MYVLVRAMSFSFMQRLKTKWEVARLYRILLKINLKKFTSCEKNLMQRKRKIMSKRSNKKNLQMQNVLNFYR